MFDYRLGLMTGVDLPIPELQLTVHQPTIKEISMVGEQDFFIGIQLLCIDKKNYIEDEAVLFQTNNFYVLMTILENKEMADKKAIIQKVMLLLFPNAKVIFTPRSIMINQNEENVIIDEGNFENLQFLLREQFCLKGSGQEQFNPQSKKAKEIAQKLMKARQKVAEIKAKENSGSMFGQYLSILSIGLSISLQEIMELTMYQIYDLVERYSLYINWDIDIRSRMAGAKVDKPIENWMINIH